MANLEFGSVTVDTDRIAPATRDALVHRALAHIMQNECAAAHPKADDGSHEVARNEWRMNKVAQLYNGTLGVRIGGPRKDPVEAKLADLIAKSIKARLTNAGVKLVRPKKGEDFEAYADFGNGVTRAWSAMVAATEASEGTKLRHEAERLVAAESRATKAPKAEGPVSAETLGF